MQARTLVRIAVLVVCIAVTGLGYRNTNGDNSDAVAAATAAACSTAAGQACSANLEQTARGSFGHEYGFETTRTQGGKQTKQKLIVACERALLLIGDWQCKPK